LIAGLLVLLAFGSYGTVLVKGGWIWDDDDYVLNNRTVRAEEGLKSIWTDSSANPQYYPMVYTTFRLEYQSNPPEAKPAPKPGDPIESRKPTPPDPTRFHFNNVLIFAITVLLFWRVLQKLRIPGGLLAVSLFAAHPINVESVAWITERKNMLSGMFAMAAVLMYLRYARIGNDDDNGQPKTEMPDTGIGKSYWAQLGWGSFALSLLFWFAGLFSKTVIAFVPPALFLIIWWKRPRELWRLSLGLLPFLAAGIYFGLRTAKIEREQVGASESFFDLTFLDKFVLAGKVVWTYLLHIIAPFQQMFFYPKWEVDSGSLVQWLILAAAIALPLVLLWKSKKLGRGPLVAILIFGGALFPVMGFVPVYPMRFSWVADHFQYHANFAMFALLGAMLIKIRIPQNVGRGVLGVVLGLLAWKSNAQGLMYQNVETLWRTTVEVNPTSWMAHENLGVELKSQGRMDEALEVMHKGLEIHRDPHLLQSVANVHMERFSKARQQNDLDLAQAYIEEALETWPKRIDFNMVYGTVLYFRGPAMHRQAMKHFENALTSIINDDYQKAFLNEKLQSANIAMMVEKWLSAAINEGNRSTYQANYAQALVDYSTSYQRYEGPETNRWRDMYRWGLRSPFMSMEMRRIWTMAACADKKVRDPQTALAQVRELLQIAPAHLQAGGVSQAEQLRLQVALQDLMAVCFANSGQYIQAIEIAEKAINQAVMQKAPPAYVGQLRDRISMYRKKQPFYYQKLIPLPQGL
jgi:tetratricopeptide (TPR) repeat protein